MYNTELANDILRTLAYFDLSSYPMTAREVWQNLYGVAVLVSLVEVMAELDNLVRTESLFEKEGFYFLPKREAIVGEKKANYLHSLDKLKKNRLYLQLLSRLPFIKAIFLCNNMGMLNVAIDSDVDLAIVAEEGHLWTARFFSALLLSLLDKRPRPGKESGQLCLSFYMTPAGFNLQPLAYENDIHLKYWLGQFLPVYDPVCAIDEFTKANEWVRQDLPNRTSVHANSRFGIRSKCLAKTILEKLFAGKFVERWLKTWQLRIMPLKLQELAAENNSNVVLSDTLLKFHDHDTRISVRDAWQDKVSELLKPSEKASF